MIEKITQLVEENWDSLPSKKTPYNKESVFVTKFCQRIVGYDTKVLFLITHKGTPVCIVKMTRDVDFNERLRREKEAQESVVESFGISIPRVYFDGTINGYYVYAEEVIQGNIISKRLASKYERDIVDFVRSFPVSGDIQAKEVAGIFSEFAPKENAKILELIQCIRDKDVVLKKGFMHGDFGRSNIIYSSNKLNLIDWGRAGEIPFWLIDAVYFMAGNSKHVNDMEDWQKVIPIFSKYTGVDTATAEALYCIMMVFKILRKKYPDIYFAVIERFSNQ